MKLSDEQAQALSTVSARLHRQQFARAHVNVPVRWQLEALGLIVSAPYGHGHVSYLSAAGGAAMVEMEPDLMRLRALAAEGGCGADLSRLSPDELRIKLALGTEADENHDRATGGKGHE